MYNDRDKSNPRSASPQLTTDSRFPFLDLDKLAGNLTPGVKPAVKLGVGFDGFVFVLILNVNITSQMWLVVTTYLELI